MIGEVVEIHVLLLNEGTTTARPAPGKMLSEDIYEIILPDDYDPEDEEWQFVPGDIVRCEWQPEEWGDKPILLAVSKVER